MPVYVRPHTRRAPPKQLVAVASKVLEGKLGGYTYTGQWKFNLSDKKSMDALYKKLGDRIMYVIATTNRIITSPDDLEVNYFIGPNWGVGLWRDPETGKVFADEIMVHLSIGDIRARDIGKAYKQKSILKIDGFKRTYEFLDV
jgi:hypothetical protein